MSLGARDMFRLKKDDFLSRNMSRELKLMPLLYSCVDRNIY